MYKLGCAVFATFFVRCEANLGEYGSYSHHSLHIRFKILSQIRIQIFDLMQKIHVAENIRFIFAYIRFEPNIAALV